jgi:hypothetical protein
VDEDLPEGAALMGDTVNGHAVGFHVLRL